MRNIIYVSGVVLLASIALFFAIRYRKICSRFTNVSRENGKLKRRIDFLETILKGKESPPDLQKMERAYSSTEPPQETVENRIGMLLKNTKDQDFIALYERSFCPVLEERINSSFGGQVTDIPPAMMFLLAACLESPRLSPTLNKSLEAVLAKPLIGCMISSITQGVGKLIDEAFENLGKLPSVAELPGAIESLQEKLKEDVSKFKWNNYQRKGFIELMKDIFLSNYCYSASGFHYDNFDCTKKIEGITALARVRQLFTDGEWKVFCQHQKEEFLPDARKDAIDLTHSLKQYLELTEVQERQLEEKFTQYYFQMILEYTGKKVPRIGSFNNF